MKLTIKRYASSRNGLKTSMPVARVGCVHAGILQCRNIKLDKTKDYWTRQGRRNWGGGRRGSCLLYLLLGGARGAKVPFKYKEYYITVSFQGAFS